MSVLGNGALKGLFSSALAPLYEDATFIRSIMLCHEETGAVYITQAAPLPVKVQIDTCTETMRQEHGYSDEDVRILMLQAGFKGAKPNSDDIITMGSMHYKIATVQEDPAHSFFDIRAVRHDADYGDSGDSYDNT